MRGCVGGVASSPRGPQKRLEARTVNDSVDFIAAELAKHRPYGLDCKCGRPINSDADWSRHTAEVLDAALGRLQWGIAHWQLQGAPMGHWVGSFHVGAGE